MKTITRQAVANVLGLALTLGISGAVLGPASSAWAQDKPAPKSTETKVEPKVGDKVQFTLRSGRKVEGEVVAITDTAYKIKGNISGIKFESEVAKDDVLSLKVTEAASTDKPDSKPESKPDAAKPDTKPDSKPDSKTDAKADAKEDKTPAKPDATGPRVYVINMRGEFGRDINVTPMERIYKDIVEQKPDVLVCYFDHEFKARGETKEDYEPDLGAFDELETARKLAEILRSQMESDPDLKVKPRLVAWIRKAMGGAAFLPFACPDMYYTSDAVHGGIGYLEHIFDGRGDERAREKQYSLRQARGEGMAQFGGHDSRILRAMARTNYVLSVTFKDGTPKFVEHMPESPDEILLTDDGEGPNQDNVQDIIRGRGNDTLTLDADMALRIGLSKGTADTLDDLMDRMGIPRNYQLLKGKSDQILQSWSRDVSNAEDNIERLIRDRRELRVKPPAGYTERTAFRGQQKRILREIQSILMRYKESINPQRVGGPEATINTIDRLITQLDADQRADRPEK